MPIAKILYRLLILIAVCGAAYLIWRALDRYSVSELVAAVSAIPRWRIAAAIGFAAASYLCLTGFDYLALHYAGKPLAYRRAALASFASLSIGHNVGVAALSSGAIRYRFYSRWGLGTGDVAKVIVFCGLTVGLGLSTLAGIGLMLFPDDAEGLLKLGRTNIVAIAATCLLLPVAYMLLVTFVRGSLSLYKWSLQLPAPGLAFSQIMIGTINFAFVAACLHQLIAATTDIAYPKAAAIYAIANGTALVSHVPGGLGVLEATVLYFVPGASALAAVIAFRVIYFFIPLALGLPTLLASEYVLRNTSAASEEAAG